jgi:hypothetical protein
MIKVKVDKDDEAIDIPSMREMSDSEYVSYIASDVFFVDHHDILRATFGEYPIATSARQVEFLISHLQKIAARMNVAAR